MGYDQGCGECYRISGLEAEVKILHAALKETFELLENNWDSNEGRFPFGAEPISIKVRSLLDLTALSIQKHIY